MKLTEQLKAQIDQMSYRELLSKWRFTPVGDPMFQDESGKYFGERMAELRRAPGGDEKHVAASKSLGW